MSRSTISVVYDAEQDRLKLLLVSKQREQVVGVMTRRLFKGVLAQLPSWLEKQVAMPVSSLRSSSPQVALQRNAVVSFQHFSAREEPQEKVDASISQVVDLFVIGSVNFSLVGKGMEQGRLVQLKFSSKDSQKSICLSLTTAELHRLIGIMMRKCEGWDLTAPWKLDDFSGCSGLAAAGNEVH